MDHDHAYERLFAGPERLAEARVTPQPAREVDTPMHDYTERFVRDPRICGGEAVIRGTRVTVRTLLASLAEGATVAEIVADYPTVTAEDVWAVIAFAAASAEDDLPVPAVPDVA